jgi:hypothetical protein
MSVKTIKLPLMKSQFPLVSKIKSKSSPKIIIEYMKRFGDCEFEICEDCFENA